MASASDLSRCWRTPTSDDTSVRPLLNWRPDDLLGCLLQAQQTTHSLEFLFGERLDELLFLLSPTSTGSSLEQTRCGVSLIFQHSNEAAAQQLCDQLPQPSSVWQADQLLERIDRSLRALSELKESEFDSLRPIDSVVLLQSHSQQFESDSEEIDTSAIVSRSASVSKSHLKRLATGLLATGAQALPSPLPLQSGVQPRKSVGRKSVGKANLAFTPVEFQELPSLRWNEAPGMEHVNPRLTQRVDKYRYEYGNIAPVTEKDSELVFEKLHLDINHYEKFFASQEHSNYLANDPAIGPVCLSIAHDKNKIRVIFRTKLKDEKLIFHNDSLKHKDVIKILEKTWPFMANIKLVQMKSAEFERDLQTLESKLVGSKQSKFGILYCREGQTEENQMFNNDETSSDFNEFLNLIGTRVTLQGFDKFRGGLDVKSGTTGKESVYTCCRDFEIMFHVSVLLPFHAKDEQHLERKRHLGNDIIVVVFKEGPQLFNPTCIRSEFNHIFMIVQREPRTADDPSVKYRVEICCKDGVPHPARPLLPNPPIIKAEAFREFFLTKLINYERAAIQAPEFEARLTRTRTFMMNQLVKDHLGP